VLIAKPLLRAMKSVGEGIVDARSRPAWKSACGQQRSLSLEFGAQTSFRRGALAKETRCN
jgi:hypothetical protein